MQQLLMLVMIIFHFNVDILRQNMRLNAECRNYKYTKDHVNHLVDVSDIIIYIGKYIGHVGLECTTIKLYLANPTPSLALVLPGLTY